MEDGEWNWWTSVFAFFFFVSFYPFLTTFVFSLLSADSLTKKVRSNKLGVTIDVGFDVEVGIENSFRQNGDKNKQSRRSKTEENQN